MFKEALKVNVEVISPKVGKKDIDGQWEKRNTESRTSLQESQHLRTCQEGLVKKVRTENEREEVT